MFQENTSRPLTVEEFRSAFVQHLTHFAAVTSLLEEAGIMTSEDIERRAVEIQPDIDQALAEQDAEREKEWREENPEQAKMLDDTFNRIFGGNQE